jgi:hypothetical protein
MKIIEIVPRGRTKLYGRLVDKQAAIHKSGRGTYVRVGRKTQRAARWKHKKFKGTLDLNRADSEVVTAKVRAATPEDERKLLSSFLGFVDRHADDYDSLPLSIRQGASARRGAMHRGLQSTAPLPM